MNDEMLFVLNWTLFVDCKATTRLLAPNFWNRFKRCKPIFKPRYTHSIPLDVNLLTAEQVKTLQAARGKTPYKTVDDVNAQITYVYPHQIFTFSSSILILGNLILSLMPVP